jgi:ABC-type bacteriocin/lantibiotic exporter with double-glycine peptidase domain
MAVAETTGLDRLVETLPMRYNTVLPQGGGSLSGGQRQLVALTAVMASDRSLMLLDEAMANLDWISRSWLHQSEWFKDKTVIYASHEAGLG